MKSLLLLIGLLAVIGCRSPKAVPLEIGSHLPSLQLPTPDGDSLDLATLQDGVLILNFWATWCGPCQNEIPHLSALAAENPRVHVVGISLDENLKALEDYLQRHTLAYPVVLGDQKLFGRMQGTAIPYTLLFDRERKLVDVHRGPMDRQALENWIAPLL